MKKYDFMTAVVKRVTKKDSGSVHILVEPQCYQFGVQAVNIELSPETVQLLDTGTPEAKKKKYDTYIKNYLKRHIKTQVERDQGLHKQDGNNSVEAHTLMSPVFSSLE